RIYLAAIAVFAAAAALTIYYARGMAGGMRMPGGWTMSMMWMMGHGPVAAIAFIGVWAIMMVAMMLPSTLPMLLLYRRVIVFHGGFCAACCWGLMLIQLALGVMSLPVMAAVAILIALEKLAPRGELLAKLIGAAAMVAGIVLLARALR